MKPPTKFRLVNAGPMGEPEVVKALLGPQTQVSEITLDGFEVRRQPRPPENVWKIIKEFWDDAGHPYGGAYSLVPKKGAKAVVGCVEFNSLDELQRAVKKLGVWSFHDRKSPKDAWFNYKRIPREGDIPYFTERVNADPATLESVANNYRETSEYSAFVAEMAKQANGYRESLEPKDPELRAPAASGESKA